ncbi:alpha-hydroxy acid oxidase [Cognatishimia sp. SS12]|uniref:alpha-hydroxy acid oxidase n=1 Tax=Cognatishimia sp. SS12 TaxID=2979465 RepID=UPI00232B2B93|nr:alpha-hydroxy acid oxidase [Cognatishimia sp. SS12]MDC0739547.1 alpha-hydroxy acid oxidase [Cognatishimia sp. SS12]
MDLANKYPSIWHLADRAKKRIPFFAWEYLDSGTGMERLVDRNRAALDAVHLTPRVLGGRFTPDLTTTLFGQEFSAPFGAAPVGMSGLMWPGAEKSLARMAAEKSIPYGLSMVANEDPETVAGIAPDQTWMQIYAPKEPEVLDDLIQRSKAAGVKTLIVTVDVPVGSRRERQLAAGLTVPPKMNAQTLWRVAVRPEWALATLAYGQPRFRTLERYFPQDQMREGAKLIGNIVDGRPDWAYFDRIRAAWDGNLILKGIMDPQDAKDAIAHGADAVWVSNHGGRQFDGSPAAIDALPAIADAVAGRVPVMFDSGIRGGLDILRALSLGADFCFLGRAFLYAIAALGDKGATHAYDILRGDLENNMVQIGAKSLADLRSPQA